MYFSTVLLVIASLAVTAVSAAPAPGTNQTGPGTNQTAPQRNQTTIDISVLNYALTLEHLEAAFFKQGVAKFNASAFSEAGYPGPVRDRLILIAEHENSHVSVLTNAITKLKGQPVQPCNYSFPLDNVTTFLAVSQALENTGVSAYLGALSGLKGGLLTVAASIATAEARQASYLNELWNQTGFPYPRDTALTPRQVMTLASNFITSCPFNMTLTPFAQLNATLPANGTGMVTTSFTGPQSNDTSSLFCQFLYGPKTVVSVRSNCTLPTDAVGYIFLLLTNSTTPITAKNDSSIVAGPALLFNTFHNITAPSNTTTPSNTTMSPTMSPTSMSVSPTVSPTSMSVSPTVSPTTISVSPTVTSTASPTATVA
ncbi:hypothetical protein CPB97_005806 [Podila verticillata]|nr:hypothetical protein CPB97_005806 [Podila verticillata]